MKAVVVGCGRVGAAVARSLASEGWDVTCVDDDEAALARLGSWKGGFVIGHALDLGVLADARIDEADAVVLATRGDNTNVVVGQVVQRTWNPTRLVVRVKDPARAEFYEKRGLTTVCPTRTSIDATLALVHAGDATTVRA